MNKPAHDKAVKQVSEHGATRSYVIGFLLSLLFTAIPYYLVVNHLASSSVLLATILGIAVLQMFVQIIFFLHLGRGPKPLYNITFFAATVGIILVVVCGSIFIMNNLHYNMTPAEVTRKLAQDEAISQIEGVKTGACQVTRTNHQVTIFNGKVSPLFTNAQLCDTITFINNDDAERTIAFGLHPQHDGYSGQDELLVRRGRSKTITLNLVGTYRFHDHLDPSVGGNFTVSQ